jgi:hypothetical protein
MAARIGIRILEKDYQAFRALAPGDQQFALGFQEWKKRHATGGRQVTVRPDAFAEFCRRIGQPPSFDALGAYALVMAKKRRGA